jgi:hypothetical protein
MLPVPEPESVVRWPAAEEEDDGEKEKSHHHDYLGRREPEFRLAVERYRHHVQAHNDDYHYGHPDRQVHRRVPVLDHEAFFAWSIFFLFHPARVRVRVCGETGDRDREKKKGVVFYPLP